jgi:hypothetical protein
MAGNSASVSFTGINIDKTPPNAPTASISPAPNAAGWNKTDATVSFVSNGDTGAAQSGVASCTGPATLTQETSGTAVSGACTDNAGNTSATTSTTVKIDKTAPTATASAAPAPNANGWNNTDVVVSFTGTDALSGVASCSPPATLSGDGAGQSASGTCTDVAGNVSPPATATGINIDKTKPTIAITAPTAGPYLTSGSLTIAYSTADALSGVASASATLDGNPVSNGQVINLAAMAGTHTFVVTATDRAGNTHTASVTFAVRLAATVDIDPDTLNLKSKGNDITVYIEFPSGYSVNAIDVGSVRLKVNGVTIPAQSSPTAVGDNDKDGVPDRMVKFDRQAVIAALGSTTGSVSMEVSGQLTDGRPFVGSDTVRVINP